MKEVNLWKDNECLVVLKEERINVFLVVDKRIKDI